jgi:gas vesicle structural protein
MDIMRAAPQASVTEVLDRVLDRGIVIDAWLRVSVVGITLIDVDAHVVVASIDTYGRHSDSVTSAVLASRSTTQLQTAAVARPRTRRPVHRLRCDEGCTVVRRAHRCPAKVHCPSEQGRICPVAPMPRAA